MEEQQPNQFTIEQEKNYLEAISNLASQLVELTDENKRLREEIVQLKSGSYQPLRSGEGHVGTHFVSVEFSGRGLVLSQAGKRTYWGLDGKHFLCEWVPNTERGEGA